jgi:hypothetical protein
VRPLLLPGELLSLAGAAAVLVSMFALEWFGLVGIPGRTRRLTGAENAWHAMPIVRWLMLAAALAPVIGVSIHIPQRSHGTKTSTGPVVTGLGTLTLGVLIVRVLVDLPSPREVVDQKLGAFLGLLGALAIALGGYETLRAERVRRASVEPSQKRSIRTLGSALRGRYGARTTKAETDANDGADPPTATS